MKVHKTSSAMLARAQFMNINYPLQLIYMGVNSIDLFGKAVSTSSLRLDETRSQAILAIIMATKMAASASITGYPSMAPSIPTRTAMEENESVRLCHAFASKREELVS